MRFHVPVKGSQQLPHNAKLQKGLQELTALSCLYVYPSAAAAQWHFHNYSGYLFSLWRLLLSSYA